MKDLLCDEFQQTVDHVLIRHRSILDIMSKLQESSARITRSVAKAVTECGCIRINGSKQKIPVDTSLREIRRYMDEHVEGTLCEQCKETVENEIGNYLFYLAALSNTLDLNVYDILLKEHKKLTALGVYNLT